MAGGGLEVAVDDGLGAAVEEGEPPGDGTRPYLFIYIYI